MSVYRLALLSLLLLFVACEPQLRIRMLDGASLRDLGYTRFDVTVGQARTYTNVLDLKTGRATPYQALEADGSQWANRFTITAASNDGTSFILFGNLVPDTQRSFIQPGNRYVWDLTISNYYSVSLD